MISTAIIAVCGLILIFYFVKLLSASYSKGKIIKERESAKESMSKLDHTIMLSVMTVNKSMVNSLKDRGLFLQLEKEEVFYEAKDRIMDLVKEDDIAPLGVYIKNIDEWIDNRIEYYVNILKK